MSTETWGVLAGAYRGRAIEKRVLLTHSVEDGSRVLCGRVPIDHVTWDSNEHAYQRPTCAVCAKRDPRFQVESK